MIHVERDALCRLDHAAARIFLQQVPQPRARLTLIQCPQQAKDLGPAFHDYEHFRDYADSLQDEEHWLDLRLELPLTDPWDKAAAILSAIAYQLRVARQAVNFAAAIHQGSSATASAGRQPGTGCMLRALCAPVRAWVRTEPEGLLHTHVLDLLSQFEAAGKVLRPGAAQWILTYAMPTALVDNATDAEVASLDDALPTEDLDELFTRAQRQAARDRS